MSVAYEDEKTFKKDRFSKFCAKSDFPQKAFICPPLDVGDPVQIAAKKGQCMSQLPVQLQWIDNKSSEWSVTKFWKVASPGPEAGPRGQVSD